MIDDIAKGIKDRIDGTLGATLRGYISDRYYYNTVPSGTAFPFVTYSSIADVDFSTFTEEIDYTHWQFSVWDNELDPMSSGHLKDITKAIRALFDGVVLVIGVIGGTRYVSRTYDSLDTLTYDDMDLLTYDELDLMLETYNEYTNFGTIYMSQRDIPQQDNEILHRTLEYEIYIQKN
jgi:hypothetical protein